jgi:hypothetical protein
MVGDRSMSGVTPELDKIPAPHGWHTDHNPSRMEGPVPPERWLRKGLRAVGALMW